ncbi:MAG: hypothetical protein WCS94_25095 [Verrucomicrobiota bacterium]
MKIRQILVPAVISVALALPVGGFLFGFCHCDDGGWNLLGRSLVGCVFAMLTTITFGFPPKNEGLAGDPYNAWPYIMVAGLVIFGAGTVLLYCKHHRKLQ